MLVLGRIQLSLLLILLIGVVVITFRWQVTFTDMSRAVTGTTTLPAAAEVEKDEYNNEPALRYDEKDPRIAKARERIDARFCGGPCRFLLPVFIMEQESKAQMHFRQLAFMAGMINRTIVLPNVGGSRLGACQEHDFSLYYSEQWARDNSQYFRYITMADFKAWLKERNALGVRATSQTLHIHLGRSQHKDLGEVDNCLAPLMNTDILPERSLYLQDSGNAQRRRPYQKIIREFLTGESPEDGEKEEDLAENDESQQEEHPTEEEDLSFVTQNLEVLSVYYDRRYPFIQNPAADIPIPYSEHITQIADDIARQMAPYWAIHWRTERVEPAENLIGCAESLVSLLKSHFKTLASASSSSSPTTTPAIFLLTDYPHVFSQEAIEEAIENNTTDSLNPASASFSAHYFTRYHHQAIQYLYENLPIHVTSLVDDQNENRDGEDDDMHLPSNWTVIPVSASLAGNDSGILGILDKLLAIRSDLFIAGRPGVCARKSSFTTRIIDERLNLLGDNNVTLDEDWEDWGHKMPGKIMNIIEYFDLPQDENDEEK